MTKPMCLAWLLAALLGAAPANAAEAQTFSGDYTVSFLGFTVARSNFSSRFDGATFQVEGTVESAGFGRFFDDTDGTVSTSGRFADDRTQPTAFRVDYTQKKKPTITTIDFNRGRVTRTETIPTPKPKGPTWIPVAPGDLAAVNDPLSATLVKADGPDAVCRRTVRVYDGEFRLDLTLHPVSTGSASIRGYEGATVTCRATVKPVSGYRKGRKALEFLERKSRIMVAFAQLGTTGVYAPIHATVGTQIGTVTIKARRFEATN